MIRVLKCEPNKRAEIVEIGEDLESLQKIVAGYIECFYPYEDPIAIIVNEEGKINGSRLSRAVCDENGEIIDIIAGTFVIVGLVDEKGEDDGEFHSLPENLLDKYMKMFEYPEQFVRVGRNIKVIKIKG